MSHSTRLVMILSGIINVAAIHYEPETELRNRLCDSTPIHIFAEKSYVKNTNDDQLKLVWNMPKLGPIRNSTKRDKPLTKLPDTFWEMESDLVRLTTTGTDNNRAFTIEGTPFVEPIDRSIMAWARMLTPINSELEDKSQALITVIGKDLLRVPRFGVYHLNFSVNKFVTNIELLDNYVKNAYKSLFLFPESLQSEFGIIFENLSNVLPEDDKLVSTNMMLSLLGFISLMEELKSNTALAKAVQIIFNTDVAATLRCLSKVGMQQFCGMRRGTMARIGPFRNSTIIRPMPSVNSSQIIIQLMGLFVLEQRMGMRTNHDTSFENLFNNYYIDIKLSKIRFDLRNFGIELIKPELILLPTWQLISRSVNTLMRTMGDINAVSPVEGTGSTEASSLKRNSSLDSISKQVDSSDENITKLQLNKMEELRNFGYVDPFLESKTMTLMFPDSTNMIVEVPNGPLSQLVLYTSKIRNVKSWKAYGNLIDTLGPMN